MQEIKEQIIDKMIRLNTSPKMQAIIACLLGQEWTNPVLDEILVNKTEVLGHLKGDCGYNDFIGATEDFLVNVRGCVDAVKLTKEQREVFAIVAVPFLKGINLKKVLLEGFEC
jgi:hypothetical protein